MRNLNERRFCFYNTVYLNNVNVFGYVMTGKHKIGEHGAVGFLTRQGRICAECGEPIDFNLVDRIRWNISKKRQKLIHEAIVKMLKEYHKFFEWCAKEK